MRHDAARADAAFTNDKMAHAACVGERHREATRRAQVTNHSSLRARRRLPSAALSRRAVRRNVGILVNASC